VLLRQAPEAGRTPKKTNRRGASAEGLAAGDRPLFEALRVWRAQAAKAQHVPPYVIFHDRTLVEIAQARPASRAALARLPGVGEAKLAHYADDVLKLVAPFVG